MEVVVGPPFSGKDRKVAAVRQPGDAVLDTTPIWRTFASPEPGAVRSVEDAAIANSMKRKGLERAVEQGRDGYVIVASRDPARLSKWLDAAGQAKALLVTAPHTTLIDRARAHGPECEELLTAWKNFEADQEYMDLVDAWDATAIPDRQRGNTVTDEIRCAIECREDDTRQGPGRLVGTVLTYGQRAKDRAELFEKDSLSWPDTGVVLNRQHARGAPIMRVIPEVRGETIVIDQVLPNTTAGRDAAAEIRQGLMRGLSVSFQAARQEHRAGVRRIHAATMTAVGLVDSPSYDAPVEVRQRARDTGPRAETLWL